MSEPASVIDVDYVTSDAEDEYDAACLDAALAEPDAGEFIPLDDALAMFGLTREDVDQPQA
jgi:hypothetical protein